MTRLPFWQWVSCLSALVLCGQPIASAANWKVSAPTSVLIDTTSVAVSELGGITYLGQSTQVGHYNFAAVQDSGGKLITLDVEVSPTGALVSARSVTSLTLSANLDFEGAAFTNPTRNSVFLSDENGPGLREFDLSDGSQLQSVAIPSVFTNRRANRGFESLARSPDGSTMWVANEEALTVDGALAASSTGTTVRILRLNVEGNTVSAAEQFAYGVQPIHLSGIRSERRSGLADLVALPDGTLFGLERSFDVGVSTLFYKSSIYEIKFAGATDISAPPFNTGLIGKTYTPVVKELVWSGSAAGANGQNLEGLTLGPRLANGNWLLVGVVDNSDGGDPVSFNTLVTFELSANLSADFDEDGDVDGRDFLAWQRGFGQTIGAKLSEGDADRDGDVDADDLAVWQADYGATVGATVGATLSVPEPNTVGIFATAFIAIVRRSNRRRLMPGSARMVRRVSLGRDDEYQYSLLVQFGDPRSVTARPSSSVSYGAKRKSIHGAAVSSSSSTTTG